MFMRRYTQAMSFLIISTVLCSCSKSEPPLTGKREDVIISDLAIDISPNAGTVQLKKSTGNPYIGTLDFAPALEKLWEYKFYNLALNGNIMTASPIVANGCVFIMDAGGIVHCIDGKTGKLLWKAYTTVLGETGQSGGAMEFVKDGNKLLVSTSFSECFVFDSLTGQQLKRFKLPAPCKGDGVLVDGNTAYFNCSTNTVCAIDIETGKDLWTYSGLDRDDGYIGMSKPVICGNSVIISSASGELICLNKSDGKEIWRIIISNFSVKDVSSSISHLRATPIVEGNRIYVTSAAGVVSAVNAATGDIVWSRNIGGLTPVNIVGDHVFVINKDAEIACINKHNGAIVGVKKVKLDYKKRTLQDKILFRKPKQEEKDWFAQFMTRDSVLHVASDGEFIFSGYSTDQITNRIKTGRRVSIRPVLSNGIMYVLSDDGYLSAYRGGKVILK